VLAPRAVLDCPSWIVPSCIVHSTFCIVHCAFRP
jgi:hypothetical protein